MNNHKEYYIEKLPMYLQSQIPNVALGIKDDAKTMFQECTKYTLMFEDRTYKLYYILALIFKY